MSFLPGVKCGKFKLKKAFQSSKILACDLKNLKSAPFLLQIKLIKMPGSVSLFHMHALLESD